MIVVLPNCLLHCFDTVVSGLRNTCWVSCTQRFCSRNGEGRELMGQLVNLDSCGRWLWLLRWIWFIAPDFCWFVCHTRVQWHFLREPGVTRCLMLRGDLCKRFMWQDVIPGTYQRNTATVIMCIWISIVGQSVNPVTAPLLSLPSHSHNF